MIRPTIRLLALAGAALVLTLALGACASATGTVGTATSAPTAAPPTSAPTTAASVAPTTASVAPSTAGSGGSTGSAVSIKDFSFDPTGLSAKVGQEITWTNTGSAAHTVTLDTGGVDSGSLSGGATFKHTFDAAGTFTYHCSIHSSMQATVTVSQ